MRTKPSDQAHCSLVVVLTLSVGIRCTSPCSGSEGEEHAFCGALPQRKLQADLPARDTHNTFWTGQDSTSAKPLGKQQREMLSRMIASSQPGTKELFDSEDYETMYGVTTKGANRFGPVMRSVCELYRSKSVLSKSTHLSQMLKFLLSDSSVQSLIPFQSIPIIEKITIGGVDELKDNFTPETRLQLWSSGLCRAALVPLLLEVSQLLDKHAGCDSYSRIRSDCAVTLNFVLYTSDNVKVSYEPTMRARLFRTLAEDGVPKPETYSWEEHVQFVNSTVSSESGSSDAVLEGGYDRNTFYASGAHYPCWFTGRYRGLYKKDSKPAEETSSNDGGCEKDFTAKKGRTGD